MKLKRLASPLVVAVTVVGIGCTIAFAGSSPNVILCADKKTGALRYAASCKSTETLLSLTTKGDQGLPGPQGASALQQDEIRVLDKTSLYSDGSNHFRDGDSCGDGKILDAQSANSPDGYCMIGVPVGYKAYISATLGATGSESKIDAFPFQCEQVTLQMWSTAHWTHDASIVRNSEHVEMDSNRDFSNNRTHGIPLNIISNGGCVGLETRDSSTTEIAIVRN